MRCPRITIAGMMAAVAVIAFDCFLLTMSDGAGILMVGLALPVGFVCWWRGQGKWKRFWLGFEIAGLVAVVAYIGTIQFSEGVILEWPEYLLNRGLDRLPYVIALQNSPASIESQIAQVLLFELSYGVPMLLMASLGGILMALIASLPRVEHSATHLK
jgi:hypothetical protein